MALSSTTVSKTQFQKMLTVKDRLLFIIYSHIYSITWHICHFVVLSQIVLSSNNYSIIIFIDHIQYIGLKLSHSN